MVNQLIKCFLFAAIIALPMGAVWADLLPPPTPLRRIGYEVLVEVATAVAGASMLLRWVAGKVWKHPSDVTPEEVTRLKERLERILPTLRSKFDEKYKVNSVEWLAEDEKRRPPRLRKQMEDRELEQMEDRELAWMLKEKFRHPGEELPYMRIRRLDDAWRTLCNDLLFSILESDAELRKECDGIPIEFLCNAMFPFGAYRPPEAYEGYYKKDDSGGLSDFQIRADMQSLSDPRCKEFWHG